MSERNEYPVAHHPSDNASLRPSYKKPLKIEVAFVKDDRGVSTTAIWLLVQSEENCLRYNAIADSDPQATRIDILRQAGATFYPHCKLCFLSFPFLSFSKLAIAFYYCRLTIKRASKRSRKIYAKTNYDYQYCFWKD